MASTSFHEIHPVADPLFAMRQIANQLVEITNRYALHERRELLRELQGLQRRTATEQLTLAILSSSRDSKSKLLHALLHITSTDAAIPASTVACTYLAYGVETEAAVTLTNSLTARLPLAQLAEFVSNKVPTSSLQKVLVRLPLAALQNGLVLIDTPELTGDLAALVSTAATALADADACVLAVDARAGLPENVISFLNSVQGRLTKFFFVLESAEGLSDLEQKQGWEALTQSLERRCSLPKPRVTLLSLPTAEGDRAPLWNVGLEAFETTLMEAARVNSRCSLSNEVARLAAETLRYAEHTLQSRGTPLRHARLRAGVRELYALRQLADDLALATNSATPNLADCPTEETSPGFMHFSGGIQTAFAVEADAPFAAEEPSEIPDSVKAWYAMPIGPPVKPAKRSFMRRGYRTGTTEQVTDGTAPSGSSADAFSGLESSKSKDKEESTPNGSTPAWRLAGLTAAAATAGVLLITTWPHASRAHAPQLSTSQAAKPHLQPASSSAATPIAPQPETVPMNTVPMNTGPVSTAPLNVEKPSGVALDGIAIPPPVVVDSLSAGTLVNADPRPTIAYRSQSSVPGTRPLDNIRRGQRLGARQHSPSRRATRQEPCLGQQSGSQRVSADFPKRQRPGVGGLLRTIRRHLFHLAGRKDRTG